MEKKFLEFLKGMAGLAQNTHLNISLEGWTAVSALCAGGLILLGLGATLASIKAEGDKAPSQEELPEEDQQDNGDVPAEGSSDEADDPFVMLSYLITSL